MTLLEAIYVRHSVRSYLSKPIPAATVAQLQAEIAACNTESGLHIQLVAGEKKAFSGLMAHYGHFRGVENYVALIGAEDASLDEKAGYWGERIVLRAQTLGLNTCWVALTVSKRIVKTHCTLKQGEKLVCVIALGYGTTQGNARSSKSADSVCTVTGDKPEWLQKGVEAALLAPTAINQQRFLIALRDGKAEIRSTGGVCSRIDLGIVRYHFEVAAGKEHLHELPQANLTPHGSR